MKLENSAFKSKKHKVPDNVIFEVQELNESGYLHLLYALREDGVRYSMGCFRLETFND